MDHVTMMFHDMFAECFFRTRDDISSAYLDGSVLCGLGGSATLDWLFGVSLS